LVVLLTRIYTITLPEPLMPEHTFAHVVPKCDTGYGE